MLSLAFQQVYPMAGLWAPNTPSGKPPKKMTPIKDLPFLSLCLLAFSLDGYAANAQAESSEGIDSGRQDGKPNVLFIAIDDLNDWTGMLKGNRQAKTPHMERLASKGIVFTNAHCASPNCGPSRSAIMSGIRPSTSGNYENRNSLTRNPILNKSVLLPEFFGRNGYYVCGSGKLFHGAHFNDEIQGRGFDDYYPSKTQDQFPWIDRFASARPLNGIKKGLDHRHGGPLAENKIRGPH